MCKKSKQKIPRNILIKKEPAKTQKKLLLVQQEKKKERKAEEKKYKDKFAVKQSEFKWTDNKQRTPRDTTG